MILSPGEILFKYNKNIYAYLQVYKLLLSHLTQMVASHTHYSGRAFFHLNLNLDYFTLNTRGESLFCFTVLCYAILWIYSVSLSYFFY